MTREESIEVLEKMKYPQKVNKNGFIISNVNIENEALEMAIKALENHDTFMKYAYSLGKHDALSQEPCTDAVSRGVFEQVMWERDIAIEQLHELGYEFGQKIEPCDDTISRSDMLDAIGHGTTYTSEELQKIITNLPPVTQKYTVFHCPKCGYQDAREL